MTQNIKIAPITINGNPKKSSIIDVFVAEPPVNKEYLAGKLFILSEVAKGKKHAEKLNAFLIDKINYFYYENDKILLREKLSSLKPEHIFETALSKTNKALSSFIKSEKIKGFPDGLNITVGLVYQNEIHFCLYGENKVFLIYKNSVQADNTEEYKLIDLSKQSEKNNDNIFSNILSGKNPSYGGIFVCNEAMSEYLSAGQIKKIISTLPPRSAAEQIKNLLEKINNYISFGGIVIKEGKTNQKPSIAKTEPIVASHESIHKLNTTESTTEEILSPSGIFTFKNIFNKLLGLFSKTRSNLPPNTIVLKDKIYGKKRTAGQSHKAIGIIKTIISFPVNGFYYLLKNLPQIQFSKLGNLQPQIKNKLTDLKNLAQSSKWVNKKNLLITSFVLIISIFIFNIFSGGKEQSEQAEAENYENLISEIEKMQNHVDANLLYSNEEGAQKLFEQINEKILALPQETEEQKQKYNEFKETLETQLNDVRRITVVESPNQIADFVNIDSSANSDSITLHKDSLYISDSKMKSFYITDLSDNTITTLTELNIQINSTVSPVINDSSIYYFNQDSIIELNSDDSKLTKLTFSTDVSGNGIIAIGTYSNRLYALSKEKNQILRFNRQGNTFGNAYSWVGEKVDFSKAVDLFIDGHVYVLNSDGSIFKFLRGEKQNFDFENIEPPLEAPSKLSGSQDEGYLYVLEPVNNRLIVFDKKGQFIAQYKSNSFDNLTDFYINETDKTIYILNGNKVFQFSADFIEG